jgi:membrane-associated phospholipid phosphatase
VKATTTVARGGRGHRAALHPRAPWVWAIVLLVAFGVVVSVAGSHAGAIPVDQAVTGWFIAHRSPALDQIAAVLTDAFAPAPTVGLAVLVSLVAVWRFRSWVSGLIVMAAVGGASAACEVMKFLVGRSRPPVAIQEVLETDYSMPSGHVTGTVAVLGMLVVVLGIRRRAAATRSGAVLAACVVAAVACSRLYLGVHWFTDVLAGLLLGATFVAIGAAVLRRHVDVQSARRAEVIAGPSRKAFVG